MRVEGRRRCVVTTGPRDDVALDCHFRGSQDNVQKIHTRIAALEQASAAVARVEAMMMKDKSMDLGLQHSLDDLKKRLDTMKLEGSGTPAMMLGELQEAVGLLWKDSEAKHRETMAAIDAIATKVASQEQTRDLVFKAVPMALKVLSEVYGQGPKEYGGSDKKAKQFDKFAGVVEERCRRELIRARNQETTRSPAARQPRGSGSGGPGPSSPGRS